MRQAATIILGLFAIGVFAISPGILCAGGADSYQPRLTSPTRARPTIRPLEANAGVVDAFHTLAPHLIGIQAGSPEVMLAGFGDSVQLKIFGVLSNDQHIDLTGTSSGTLYILKDAGIVSVDDHGVVTALKEGSTTISAINGGFTTEILATVAGDFDYKVHSQ